MLNLFFLLSGSYLISYVGIEESVQTNILLCLYIGAFEILAFSLNNKLSVGDNQYNKYIILWIYSLYNWYIVSLNDYEKALKTIIFLSALKATFDQKIIRMITISILSLSLFFEWIINENVNVQLYYIGLYIMGYLSITKMNEIKTKFRVTNIGIYFRNYGGVVDMCSYLYLTGLYVRIFSDLLLDTDDGM